ncbi:MAG: tRNA guanosine(15) transglycosylase TgtA [Thermoplasmataceae archaeon]
MFEPLESDGLARTGRFYTKHGSFSTPNIMPVVNPNLNTISMEYLKSVGTECLITNSYIIYRNLELREKAIRYGLHSLIGFDGPIMTDSGTFQSHVYSDVEVSNQEILDFQQKIGTDIATILDIFSEPDFTENRARESVEETYRRLKEVPQGYEPLIASPIQGSVYPDLRKRSAEIMSQEPAAYLPIGGVVPLLESYRYDDLVRIIIASRVNSNFGKPIHLFGGGHPMFLGMAVLLGVDMFDSASYVKYARDDRLLFPDGSRDLSKIKSLPWWSPISKKYTVNELLALDKKDRAELLSIHNLQALFNEMSEIRLRIQEQSLWQYVESRARSHPALFKAFLEILNHRKIIERFQEISKKSSFFYFDGLSNMHPYIERLREFTRNIVGSYTGHVIAPEKEWRPGKPHDPGFVSDYNNTSSLFLIPWQNEYVPLELEDTFPVEQIVTSGFRDDAALKRNLQYIGVSEAQIYKKPLASDGFRDLNIEKLRRIADFQFGIGTGKILFPDGVDVRRSRATGRIRTVLLNGKLIGTLRAHDGFLTLSEEGIRRLHSGSIFPKHRVVVSDESIQFNRSGYNVFFKFVKEADPEIIAGNEVIVVDSLDNIVAAGKATVPGFEMVQFKRGVAVNVHTGFK